MKCVYVQPQKPPEIKEIGDDLKSLQEAVGGYIEAIYPFEDNVALICNEEGKINGASPNRLLMYDSDERCFDMICGPFLIVGLTEDNFGSLTDEQAELYSEKFREVMIPIF